MKKRTLPEAAYDFFTEDGYDGEETGPFDTIADARLECRCLRAALPSYERPRIQVIWRLNESKIRRMLVNAARGRDTCGVDHEEMIDAAQRTGIQKAIDTLAELKRGKL